MTLWRFTNLIIIMIIIEVCANSLIVVKITVAVGGYSGNKTAKINVKNLFNLLLSVRVMTDDLH